MGQPTLEIWASPLWKYGLTQISKMGSPVVCCFGETILEIWVSPYWKSWPAQIGKIDNTLLHESVRLTISDELNQAKVLVQNGSQSA